MAGNLVTSPVQLPRRRPADSQPGSRTPAAAHLDRRRTAPTVPRFRRAGDSAGDPRGRGPRRVSVGQRRTARDAHDRDDARGSDRPTARSDSRHRARRASWRRPTARRSTTSTRGRSSRSTSRAASRTCAPPTASPSTRAPTAPRSSSRSTSNDGVKLFRVPFRRELRALDSLREPAAPRAAADLGRGRRARRPDRRHRHLSRLAVPRRRLLDPVTASLERAPGRFRRRRAVPGLDPRRIAGRRRPLDPQQPLALPGAGPAAEDARDSVARGREPPHPNPLPWGEGAKFSDSPSRSRFPLPAKRGGGISRHFLANLIPLSPRRGERGRVRGVLAPCPQFQCFRCAHCSDSGAFSPRQR